MKKEHLSMLVFLIVLVFFYGCSTAPVEKGAETATPKSEGKLTTSDGHKFPYKFFPANQKGPSVIFIPGMAGKTSYRGARSGGWTLAKPLNDVGLNFIGFDRYDTKYGAGHKKGIKDLQDRSQSGTVMFPTNDGKESGAKNYARNEVDSVIKFLENAPTHDKSKGIYLIGSSMGSLVSLYTVQSHPDSIRGVVFLTPALIPDMFEEARKTEYKDLNLNVDFLDSLTDSYENRPGLAIGATEDFFVEWKKTSTWVGAQFVQRKIGSNVVLMKVTDKRHGTFLVAGNKKVRKKIVEWLIEQAIE